ncbi:GNAT family N-acetyltransferase [Terrabacter sp. NPDC080008]|uniref:GNAT family N-acetyltransferase n=1 Tax=Terrabacter sp. NPDC080008 TaxID=3155176 RepID=UPI00344B0834
MTEQTGEQTGDQTGQGTQDGEGPAGSSPGGSPDSVEVTDNPAEHRFELRHGDEVIGVAAYAVVPGGADQADRLVLFHTEVRPEYEGQGLGARLAAHALDSALASGRDVVALCPYIKAYVEHHPEPYAARLVKPTRADVEAAEQASAR